jgi:hypothetical protein
LPPEANESYFEPVDAEEIEFAPHLPPVEAPQEQKNSGGSGSQATILVRLAVEGGAEFFHTRDGEPFASVPVGDHRETWPLGRKGFKGWLRRLFYEQTGGAPNSQALQDALGVLSGKALYDGPTAAVHTRVGELDGAIYHDLTDDAWGAVEITGDGWRVVADPPVHFRRTRGQAPLPHPQTGGSLEELRPFLNVDSDDDFHLFVGCLVQALRPRGPYIGYAAHGEQGSAKSTRSRVFRSLIDPNNAPLRSAPRDERDLMIAATNSFVVTLDNLSWIPDWFSDALCRLATGGGLSTRELYTDADEIIFDAQRPVLLNGIEELATRGDLLDRLVLANLPRIPDESRRPEDEFWADFNEARPRLYGALLDAVSCAMRNVEDIHLDRHPRMADAARWVTAAEPALGWEPKTFLDAYMRNRADADDLALEASPLAHLAQDVCPFTGTATDLLELLNQKAPWRVVQAKSWPRTPSVLSNRLRRLAPNLRASGVEVEFTREPGGPGGKGQRTRLVVLRAVAQQPVPSVPTGPSPGGDGAARDEQPDDRAVPSPHAVPAQTSLYEPSGDERDGRDGALRTPSRGESALTEFQVEMEFRRLFPDANGATPADKRDLVTKCLEAERLQHEHVTEGEAT